MRFNDWKYLILGCMATICVCFSISYGLNAINSSVRSINTGLRSGIDSVKGMQLERKAQAGNYYDSLSTKLNRIELLLSK